MSTHNICFRRAIRKIYPVYIFWWNKVPYQELCLTPYGTCPNTDYKQVHGVGLHCLSHI